MKDLTIRLQNEPGTLAAMGEALAKASISVEGGGAWVVNQEGIAHFLVENADQARSALEAVGIEVLKINEVIVQRLHQDQPGQLGKFCRMLAEAGVNIEVLYSDHDHQLIVVVDNVEKGKVVSKKWMQNRVIS
ncbi:amino acid-binding ACT domain-containing protein [marine bacterium AO1-C]|nr:amino acid-binding ACT domain-containing protein [marine bacterium AO1-C]